MCEELWEMMGHKTLVSKVKWPQFDAAATVAEMVTVVFQVNGKLRGQAEVLPNLPEGEAVKIALSNEKVLPHIEGKTVVKTIFVPNKIVNIVVK
jgi:leucyl-tRNA synthetase